MLADLGLRMGVPARRLRGTFLPPETHGALNFYSLAGMIFKSGPGESFPFTPHAVANATHKTNHKAFEGMCKLKSTRL